MQLWLVYTLILSGVVVIITGFTLWIVAFDTDENQGEEESGEANSSETSEQSSKSQQASKDRVVDVSVTSL